MLYLSIVEGLGGKPLIRIFFRACFLLNMSLFSLYISSCLFVSLYLSAFVRPALFVLTHFSRYCVCIAPSFFRISRTVMSWNFSNTSLSISPAWKSMLHESLRNFALARSPETARFSGRLEHPMYIFSVWGDDILKIIPSRKLIISFKLGREKNIFVKFVFIKGWKKVNKHRRSWRPWRLVLKIWRLCRGGLQPQFGLSLCLFVLLMKTLKTFLYFKYYW